MFASTRTILEQYLGKLTRFDVYSVESERGENPEDIFYLCNIKSRLYVVYETDHIGELSFVVKEATDIFNSKPLHWLVKKDYQASVGATLQTTIPDDDKIAKQALIAKDESYLRYVVLEMTMENHMKERYSPTTYGFKED